MVASLQDTSLEEECFTQALQQQESRNTAAALPLSHEAAMKWFYKDPQGEIQGNVFNVYYVPRDVYVTQATEESPSDPPVRSLHHSGDVRVVPGRLLHHDPAGEAWLRRGLPTPGRRH